jgi:hypothetical protein
MLIPESLFSAVLSKKQLPVFKLLVRTHASVADSPGSSSVEAAVDGPMTKMLIIVPVWVPKLLLICVPIVGWPSNVMVRMFVPIRVVAVGFAATTERGSFAAK